MKLLNSRPLVAADCEATGVFPRLGDRPFAWSTARDAGEDIRTDFWRAPVDPFTREVNWGDLPGPWAEFADNNVIKIFHNAKYDMMMAEMIGHPILGRIEDTMIMARVLFSSRDVGLKDLGEEWLGVSKEDEVELASATQAARAPAAAQGWKIADDSGRFGNKEWWRADYWLAPEEILERYSRLDAERALLLFHLLNPMLDEDPRLRARYEEELQLLRIVYAMEAEGVRCSRRICNFELVKTDMKEKATYRQVQEALRALDFKTTRKVPYVGPSASRKWMQVESHDINVDSPDQLKRLFYETLDFPIKRFTDKGNPSTDGDALKEMNHPLALGIATVKAMHKTKEFFHNYLLHSHWSEADGCDIMHPDFYQLGARTGRFSCRNPNLQNVPDADGTRGLVPIQARNPFGPRPGKVWIHADWSQIEMWIFAGEANDEALLTDLRTGNLHVATANRIYGQGRDIVAEEAAHGKRNSRNRAKVLNFGVVFCMGTDTMADALGCGKAEARRNLKFYYDSYHSIRPFMDRIIGLAQKDGYIWNRFGWRLEVERDLAYKAVNYIVQSSAAAHMKQKMLWLDWYFRTHPEIGARIVLTIHDEIVIEVEEARILPHLPIIRAELENHHGRWREFPKLPIEFKLTRDRWDKQEKIQ